MRDSSSRWEIDHQCPQCGGPVTLKETDRLFTCGFCRVRLYFLGGRYFRYLIPPKKAASEEIHYVPYWRFRGMYFTCPPFELKGKVIDASFLASGNSFMPETLGVRTQALKLKFVSPEVKGNFFRMKVPMGHVITKAEKVTKLQDLLSGSRSMFHRAFIGETVSMIYFPIYVKGRAICDGVLGRPMASYTKLREDEFKAFDYHTQWRVRFISTLCPNCGWDLQGSNESVVLLCGNCDSAWGVYKGSLRRIPFSVNRFRADDICYVPFWRMEAEIGGIPLRSYADLIRAANLPKAVLPKMEDQAISFWLPAFKVNPTVFKRLERLLMVAQPKVSIDERSFGKSPIAPVTLRAEAAANGLKTALAATAAARKNLFPLLPEISFRITRYALVFLPFKVKGVDLVEANMNFRLPRNTINL